MQTIKRIPTSDFVEESGETTESEVSESDCEHDSGEVNGPEAAQPETEVAVSGEEIAVAEADSLIEASEGAATKGAMNTGSESELER